MSIDLSIVDVGTSCLSARQVVDVLHGIRLNDFKYVVYIDLWYLKEYHIHALYMRMKVVDIISNHLSDLKNPPLYVPSTASVGSVVEAVKQGIETLVLHELNEQFAVEGERVYDPHKYPKLLGGYFKLPISPPRYGIEERFIATITLNTP